MKVLMQRLLAAFAASVVSYAAQSARADVPSWLSQYNDGTYTWAWDWDDSGNGVVLQGYWDNDLWMSVCGISPVPTGIVTVPTSVPVTRWDAYGEEYEVEYPVTAIDCNLFLDCAEITEVVLPDTVREIGSESFSGCSRLEKVNVPKNLRSCGWNSFWETAWLNAQTNDFVVFGPALLSYRGTNTSAVIPEGIVSISEGAFSGNETVTSVVIPDSVKEIGAWAFEECENLDTVIGAANVEQCGSSAFLRTALWADADDDAPVRVAGLIVGYKGTLPETLAIEEGVTCVADEALEECGDFTSVQFPDSLRRIGAFAFAHCYGLTELTIPDTLTSVGGEAFYDCVSLETVAIEGGTAWDGVSLVDVFTDCPVKDLSLNISGPVGWEWRLESLESLTLGDRVTEIEGGAFGSCPTLETVVFGPALESIGEEAFDGCEALENVTIPASVTNISESAFGFCTSLTNVVFEGDMDAIAMDLFSAFRGTPWLDDYIASLPPLENDDFADASELEGGTGSIESSNISATAEENDPLAYDFDSEATVWWKWTAEIDGQISFSTSGSTFDAVMGVYTGESLDELVEIGVGGGYTDDVTFNASAGTTYYIAVGGYGSEQGKIVLSWYRYRLDIQDGVLLWYRGLLPETLDIPEGVTNIAEGAFEEAEVKTVNLPSSLLSIGEDAFAWSDLTVLNGLSDDVEIGIRAFNGTPYNASLPFRLDIRDNVLVGFSGICPAVLEIPEGVVEIGECAFDGSVMGYYMENPNATDSGDDWIWCSTVSNLTEVVIPASVERIDDYAFYGNAGLSSVSIANPNTAIEWTAFNECANLSTIVMEREGYEQSGWELTFDAAAYAQYAVWDEEYERWYQETDYDNPIYAAGETLTFPTEDLSFLTNGICVTNADDQIGYLVCGECIWIPTWVHAVWAVNSYTLTFDSVGGSEVTPITQEFGTEITPPDAPVREGFTFMRWEPEVPATMPATNLTFTAVWEENDTTPEIFETEQTDAFAGDAQYTGWLRDEAGGLVGTITVKAGKPNAKTKASKVTATVIELATGKKLSYSGTATAGALANVTLSGKSGKLNVTLSDDSVSGDLGNGLSVEAAKNVFTSKDSGDKSAAASVPKKTWTVTLTSVKGYTPFTIAVAAKGKAKVTGVLPDGTKVSVSAQSVVGDGGRWCVPVMYAKKYRFGFVAWFEKNAAGQTVFSDISDLTPLRGQRGAVTAWEAMPEACGAVGSLSAGSHAFTVDAEDVAALGISGLLADLLPNGETVTVSKGKWTLAKAAKVAYKKGVLTVTPATKGGAAKNAAAAKLTFTAKTGTFKGAFTVYSVNGGRLVKTKFTVNGAVVNGVAYGTAFNKKAGSVPLVIE